MSAKFATDIVLDLGSDKIAGIAAYIDSKGEINVFSQHISNSEGLRSGAVVSLAQAEDAIANAIYLIEKDCGKTIESATISLSGALCKSHYINSSISLSSGQISLYDVQRLIKKSLSDFNLDGREVIHYFPIEYFIDDGTITQDPVGIFAKTLAVRLHIITADSNMLLNIANSMSKCHVEISDIMLAIYASGISCLNEDEKSLGSLVIDIGSHTSSYGMFLGKNLIYSSYVPIGGWYITSDIAKAFSISMQAAEKLKVLYGSAVLVPSNRDSAINILDIDKNLDRELSGGVVTTNMLSKVINPRVEEILGFIKDEYDRLGLDHLISRRIVLTGGTAMLRGIKELTSSIFEKQVRIGRPKIVPGFVEDYNPCIYSAAVGMLKIKALTAQDLMHRKNHANILSKVIAWFRQNF